jgi:hypothetical protein
MTLEFLGMALETRICWLARAHTIYSCCLCLYYEDAKHTHLRQSELVRVHFCHAFSLDDRLLGAEVGHFDNIL